MDYAISDLKRGLVRSYWYENNFFFILLQINFFFQKKGFAVYFLLPGGTWLMKL